MGAVMPQVVVLAGKVLDEDCTQEKLGAYEIRSVHDQVSGSGWRRDLG
jgi:hypothetical protein